jgi:uncharacterized membrane protein YdbT with pleckstrin-like domain
MVEDRYKLKDKSDSELHGWLAGHKSDSVEYLAGIQELMDRNDAPANRREWIVMAVAILSITVTILAIVFLY